MTSRLFKIIEEQQAGHESEPLYMVGEQLKEIAAREPGAVEILLQDLEVDGMGLADAAGALKAYADKHRGRSNCYCITPKVAEEILRKFYGLSEVGTVAVSAVAVTETEQSGFIDLGAFF